MEQPTKMTMGAMLAALRKGRGMTQAELAEQMGVTDKAVSKWERDISCPDVNVLPRLAELGFFQIIIKSSVIDLDALFCHINDFRWDRI